MAEFPSVIMGVATERTQLLDALMLILQEKVAPVPLFTDNFQRIFTMRRYHPRCENLTWFCRVFNAVLDDWLLFLFMSPSTEKFYDKKQPFGFF